MDVGVEVIVGVWVGVLVGVRVGVIVGVWVGPSPAANATENALAVVLACSCIWNRLPIVVAQFDAQLALPVVCPVPRETEPIVFSVPVAPHAA